MEDRLFIGTLLVTALYVLLNLVFLYAVPLPMLENQIEIGFLAGEAIFGKVGGSLMAGAIAVLLVSTVSAYVFLGPRVSAVMGQDLKALRLLSVKNRKGVPVNAFVFSTLLSLIFIYSSSFQQVLVYTSFLLILITTLTVGSVFVVRSKKMGAPDTYKTWGYPITPVVFLLVSLWMLVFAAMDKPMESLVSLGILVVGLLLYVWVERK